MRLTAFSRQTWGGVALLAGLVAALPATGAAPPRWRVDGDGDPLPAGALARLGSTRFRHGHPPLGLAYSRDGKALLSVTPKAILRWDPRTGKSTRVVDLPAGVPGDRPVVFSGDGRVVAVPDGRKVLLYDPDAGKRLRTLGRSLEDTPVALSGDGRVVATCATAGKAKVYARLHDITTEKVLRDFPAADRPPASLALSWDGKLLAAGGEDGRVRVWEAATGKELHAWRSPGSVADRLAFSRRGDLLASAWEVGGVRVADLRTGKEVCRFQADGFAVLLFAPDGRTLLAQDDEGQICLWEIPKGRMTRTLSGRAEHAAFAPDGKTLAAVHGSALQLWDLRTGKLLHAPRGHVAAVAAVAYSPDGKALASADNKTVRLWDAATGRPKKTFAAPEDFPGYLTFTPDGKSLLGASTEAVWRWDLGGGRRPKEFCRPAVGLSHPTCLSPGGSVLIEEDDEDEMGFHLHATASGKWLATLTLSGGFTAPAFSADGRWLALAASEGILVWDVRGAAQVGAIAGGRAARNVHALAVSPDGRAVAARLKRRGREVVYVWEVATRRPALTFEVSSDAPEEMEGVLSFSPDGRALALPGSDGAAHLYQVADGKRLRALRAGDASVRCLTFAPDGRTLATGLSDSTVLIWDVADLTSLPSQRLGPKEADRLWAELAGADVARAHAAVWKLAAAPEQALPLFKARLTPTKDDPAIARLAQQLDDDDFAVREAASRKLAELGTAAAPALRRAVKGPSPEARRRAAALLAKLKSDLSSDALRRLRAVAVLEYTGTAEALRQLRALAGGDAGAPETAAAADALLRLDKHRR